MIEPLLDDFPDLPWMGQAKAAIQPDELSKYRTSWGITMMFPAYNDEMTIGALISISLKLLSGISNDYEVVVVNDGSTDNTASVLADWEKRDPHVRVITHPTNRGYGAALISGFQAATRDVVFYTDGDGQYNPTEILMLLPHMEDYDAVQGYKIRRADPWYRIVLGALYNRIIRGTLGLTIRDVDCDFRCIRRSVLEPLKLTSENGFICSELMLKLQHQGARVFEVPIHHYPRVYGRSRSFTLSHCLEVIPTFIRFYRNRLP